MSNISVTLCLSQIFTFKKVRGEFSNQNYFMFKKMSLVLSVFVPDIRNRILVEGVSKSGYPTLVGLIYVPFGAGIVLSLHLPPTHPSPNKYNLFLEIFSM